MPGTRVACPSSSCRCRGAGIAEYLPERRSCPASLQVDLARVGWGTGADAFREVFAKQFVPRARPEEIEWFTDQLRLTTDATNAPLLEGAFHDLDVSDLARAVRVPTLVMHAMGDQAVPFEEGRTLARLIPGSQFAPLQSDNHILLERDDAFGQFIDRIDHFTAMGVDRPSEAGSERR